MTKYPEMDEMLHWRCHRFFKRSKMRALLRECNIVIKYVLFLSWSITFRGMFYECCDEMQDITFTEASLLI